MKIELFLSGQLPEIGEEKHASSSIMWLGMTKIIPKGTRVKSFVIKILYVIIFIAKNCDKIYFLRNTNFFVLECIFNKIT